MPKKLALDTIDGMNGEKLSYLAPDLKTDAIEGRDGSEARSHYEHELHLGALLGKGSFGELYAATVDVKSPSGRVKNIPLVVKRFADAENLVPSKPKVSFSVTKQDLLKQAKIHAVLREYGINSLPTFRIETEKMLAIMSDLNNLHPGSVIADHYSLSNESIVIRNLRKLINDLLTLSERASNAGIVLSPDALFLILGKDGESHIYQELYVVDLDLVEIQQSFNRDFILEKNLKALKEFIKYLKASSGGEDVMKLFLDSVVKKFPEIIL